MSELAIVNRQRARRICLPALRELCEGLLEQELGLESYELGITLLGSRAMAEANWRYLKHEGATDVITFDHREDRGAPMWGELYICVPVAIEQAASFGVAWEEELVRYVVHGVLHLLGYDDAESGARRAMKREEDRYLKRLGRGFEFRALASKPGFEQA